jgi:hypothetical protein
MSGKIKLHLRVLKFIIASVSGAIKSICRKKFDLIFGNQEKARKLRRVIRMVLLVSSKAYKQRTRAAGGFLKAHLIRTFKPLHRDTEPTFDRSTQDKVYA